MAGISFPTLCTVASMLRVKDSTCVTEAGILPKCINCKVVPIYAMKCSDSRAGLAALAKSTTESSLVWECIQVLEKLSKFSKVTSTWKPGHQEIPGKEEADRLAKERAVEVPRNSLLLYLLV